MEWRERIAVWFGPSLFAGVTFGDWLRLLRENRFAVAPSHLVRAGSISACSLGKEVYGQREWNSVVYVGDGIWDLRAAKSLRIGFVGIALGNKADLLVTAGAKHVLPDFAETAHFFNAIEFASMVID